MPADRAPSILSSILAAGARGLMGLAGARMDAGPDAFPPPPVSAAPGPVAAAAAAAAVSPGRSVMDCGPSCGGGALGYGGASLGTGGAWAVATTPSLDRATIDNVLTDELMRRIVAIMVDDCMRDRPSLSGETGELTGCIEWLDARGFWPEAERAMWYSRAYGGGGVVCFIDDGRPSDEEVDVFSVRDVVGFYALPKWYLVPDGVGSGRVRAGWYGARIGRSEHYFVTPNTALAEYVVKDPHGSKSSAMPNDLRRILAKSGGRFHRSRVIAWPYRDEMDLRLARWQPYWNGWGPGVVESCLAPFLARRSGALRLAAIMQSVVVNTLTINDLESRQSNPDLMTALQARLEFVKWCRDFMSDSLPIIATDVANKFESLTHNVAGIDKLVEAQRQYLLDVLEYPSVRLWNDSVGGMNGGSRDGEWKSWAMTVASKRKSWVWTAGSFGGGLRQAVSLSMIAQNGPTRGRLDPSVTPTWPPFIEESAEVAANTRLKQAQARAQDALVLGLTSAALLRHDPTVKVTYPSLDVDEGPLPEVDPTAGAGAGTPQQGVVPALTGPGAAPGEAGDEPETATTPGATNEALAERQAPPAAGDEADAAPPAPIVLPSDIRTEKEVAAALAMTPAAFRRWVETAKVTTYPTPPGTRGGHRYSLGEVLGAWQSAAIRRADAAAVIRNA